MELAQKGILTLYFDLFVRAAQRIADKLQNNKDESFSDFHCCYATFLCLLAVAPIIAE